MSEDPWISALQAMPVFGALGAEPLALLVSHSRTLELPAGASFFGEGEPAHGLYVLLKGRAECLRTWQGRTLVLREFGPGDCFGEMALMDFQPRSATVRALAPCQALELTPAALHELSHQDLQAFALLQMNLGREISRRLREADDALMAARFGAQVRPPGAAP